MTSSNGNIFRITGPCAGNSPVTGESPAQRPVTRSFGVFVDLHLNKWLSKQSWERWFETPSCSLWRHCKYRVKLPSLFVNDCRFGSDSSFNLIGPTNRFVETNNMQFWKGSNTLIWITRFDTFCNLVSNLLCINFSDTKPQNHQNQVVAIKWFANQYTGYILPQIPKNFASKSQKDVSVEMSFCKTKK